MAGLVVPIFHFWDRPADRLVAEFDHSILANDTGHPFVVQCEQFKTARLLLEKIRGLSSVEVLFNHEVVDLRQTGDSISVDVRGVDGIKTHTGCYLIGADGGRSIVRKRSDISLEGFTWPERFVVLTTPFDFAAERGYAHRSYFAEPGAWCNCFEVSADGLRGCGGQYFQPIRHRTTRR
jgi:3-(3-hydroxy-phenyl)propionate hydroxylase